MNRLIYIFVICAITCSQDSDAQGINNLRNKELSLIKDTVMMDSLSVIPSSEIVFEGSQPISTSAYEIDYAKSLFIVLDKQMLGKKVSITYRVFPYALDKSYEHKKMTTIIAQNKKERNPFVYEYSSTSEDIFYLNGLNKSGSISRGVAFGNNQDLSVNSSLNLQLSGRLSENVNVLASISDDNIPIQAEGNTQQLQEFDRVFIQLFSDQWKLTAGDFYMTRPKSYFMNFNKKVKGGSFEMQIKPTPNSVMRPSISAAVSKGKFARNIIQGIEGNQGPYRLVGAENENFIIVLSGTEKIYIDGKLMQRGTEFDYVIDYNTAELTFTTNRLITKDIRIVAEFQYSDRNYARSLVHFGNDYESEKLKLNLHVYSEQDSRNQSLQQELTDADKLLLGSIGDSLNQAIVPNINVVDFSENVVLYKMTDTLGYDSVFVYSTNPDSAIYQLGFSYLGPNQGNYIQVQSSANGKVYEWIQPVGGIPQGDYEPVILLVTPKTRQMAIFGGQYEYKKENYVSWEGAITNNDINTFSDKDSGDDIGYALKMNTVNKLKLSNEKIPWKFKVGTGYEYVDQYFTPIERFRSVEFQRDWNIRNVQFSSDQHIVSGFTGFEKQSVANVQYNFDLLKNPNEYDGIKNAVSTLYKWKKFTLRGTGSFLTTEGVNNTEFLRYNAQLSKEIGWFEIGVRDELEQNKFFFSNSNDSLQASSFEFKVHQVYIKSADSTRNSFLLSYQQREDNAPFGTFFKGTTFAEDVTFQLNLLKNPNHRFRTKATYRRLEILVPTLTTQKPEENILARVEYVAKFLKRVISSNTFYEIGSGLEVRKEFSFIEVQPGQGTHAYIGDANSNGVKDLNEFDIAAFQDQANFIKVFTPTNQFVRAYTNQFNQGLFLRPETRWANEKGIKKVISRFSNRTNYRVSRKVSERDEYYNPFVVNIADSNLVALNLGFLNTIYFNRTGTKFGIDFTFQDNKSRSLLTSGIESRRTLNRALKSRWNITRVYALSLLAGNGRKTNQSEFFSNRNYEIKSNRVEPKFTFQPGVKFRASVFYNYQEKENAIDYGGEVLVSQTIGSEFRYNVASKGSFRALFKYINNEFTATNNAALAYEMMEGLQVGTNMTWELNYQQNLSKHMQLSLNYNGRVSDDSPVIHTGGVQVRAFF